DLLEWLGGTPVQRLLVILDTCESGQGTGDLSALARALTPTVDARRPSGFYFVASARPKEPAFDGVFSKACVAAFDGERWGGVTQRYLHPDAVVDAVNARTAPRPVATTGSARGPAFPRLPPN